MASLNMQSSRGDKKSSMGQHQDRMDVTLRRVINILNATNTKNASTSSDKAIIQDLTSCPLKERINSNYAFPNKADATQTSIKVMRKELKEQVKRNKASRPKTSSRRDYSSSSYCYPLNEVSRPETGAAVPTLSRLSSAAESQRSVKQSEALSGKDVKWDTDSLLSRHSDTKSWTNLVNQNKNIYSRHLQSNSEVETAEEDTIFFEVETGSEKEKTAQDSQSFCSDLPKQARTSTIKTPRNKSASQSSQEANADERAEKVTSINLNQNGKIQDEREFVETLTDATLKTSLQRIIQKRRSSVCLVRSTAGLKLVDDNGAFSVIAEEKSDLELESLMAKSDSKISVASGRTSKRGSISGQKLDCGFNDDERVPSDWEIKSLRSFHSEVSQPSYYQLGNNQSDNLKRSLVYSRSISTRKKGVRSATKIPLWPDKTRKNKVEVEETRIIKPLSSKTYRPCLTATSRAKKRSNTARSSPETSQEKSHCSNKGKEDVIREFMLMYAKVKQTKKEAKSAVEENKPVRMISATPEFIVKSAIGQFLSSAVFPPERPRDSSWAREERQEDKQRTKLLKIKICMQQLASIA